MKCELCKSNVKVEGEETKYYINLDQQTLARYRSALVEVSKIKTSIVTPAQAFAEIDRLRKIANKALEGK